MRTGFHGGGVLYSVKTPLLLSVTPTGGGVRVAGTLTVRDRTNPVSFDARVASDGGELMLDGELKVNRGDYGLNWNFIGIAAMDSTIAVHAVFTRG